LVEKMDNSAKSIPDGVCLFGQTIHQRFDCLEAPTDDENFVGNG
jgi:hypothetical protein